VKEENLPLAEELLLKYIAKVAEEELLEEEMRGIENITVPELSPEEMEANFQKILEKINKGK